MREIDRLSVARPERARDMSFGERSQRDRCSRAVRIRQIQIPDATLTPHKRYMLAVRRPDRIRGMLDRDDLLNRQFVRRTRLLSGCARRTDRPAIKCASTDE